MMQNPPKYPSTPHWPWSETVHRDDTYHTNPEEFLDREVVITEKIDGGNTCLFEGEVYARSVESPSRDGWMAMVRKYHAWKTLDYPGIPFYGEDIYGIHSIEYNPVPEDNTFYLFAVREDFMFHSWRLVEKWAENLNVPTVPVRFRGIFNTIDEITDWFGDNRPRGSNLGPEGEGFVMRIAAAFPAEDFSKYVAKYVRPHHVQTNEHWRRNWQPCKIIGRID